MAGPTFSSVPEFLAALSAAQTTAGTGIQTTYGTVTPAVLSSLCSAFGAIGVTNVTPAMFETTGNNVTSGTLSAFNHIMQGLSVQQANALHQIVDGVS